MKIKPSVNLRERFVLWTPTPRPLPLTLIEFFWISIVRFISPNIRDNHNYGSGFWSEIRILRVALKIKTFGASHSFSKWQPTQFRDLIDFSCFTRIKKNNNIGASTFQAKERRKKRKKIRKVNYLKNVFIFLAQTLMLLFKDYFFEAR